MVYKARLEKTIMQGMVAGKQGRGKPRQRREKDITDAFGTMAKASRMAEDRHRFRKRRLSSNVLKRRCQCKIKRISHQSILISGMWPSCTLPHARRT